MEMIATQEKVRKFSAQMEEKEVTIKQLKARLLRSEEDHFKTLEEVLHFLFSAQNLPFHE